MALVLPGPAVSYTTSWDTTEGAVTRIWKRPFEPALRQQMRAAAERNGPFHTTEA